MLQRISSNSLSASSPRSTSNASNVGTRDSAPTGLPKLEIAVEPEFRFDANEYSELYMRSATTLVFVEPSIRGSVATS